MKTEVKSSSSAPNRPARAIAQSSARSAWGEKSVATRIRCTGAILGRASPLALGPPRLSYFPRHGGREGSLRDPRGLAHGLRGGDPQELSQARAQVPSGREPQRPEGRGALQGDLVRLRG